MTRKKLDRPVTPTLCHQRLKNKYRAMRARGVHKDDILPEQNATVENMDLKPIKPAEDPSFLQVVYGGTLMFNLALP